MKRREFIAGLGSAAAWPLTACAQQPAVPLVGFLGISSAEVGANSLAAFRKGLGETGYVEAGTSRSSLIGQRTVVTLGRVI
jgi:putative ABC transport system substrate-binding protein